MPELSAGKKLKKLKKILKIEKITSNTFVAEKIQLQTMIDSFCFDDILDKMLNYNYENSMINNIDKILDNQISNYILQGCALRKILGSPSGSQPCQPGCPPLKVGRPKKLI